MRSALMNQELLVAAATWFTVAAAFDIQTIQTSDARINYATFDVWKTIYDVNKIIHFIYALRTT